MSTYSSVAVCFAVCCSEMWCVAVCCSVLQGVTCEQHDAHNTAKMKCCILPSTWRLKSQETHPWGGSPFWNVSISEAGRKRTCLGNRQSKFFELRPPARYWTQFFGCFYLLRLATFNLDTAITGFWFAEINNFQPFQSSRYPDLLLWKTSTIISKNRVLFLPASHIATRQANAHFLYTIKHSMSLEYLKVTERETER